MSSQTLVNIFIAVLCLFNTIIITTKFFLSKRIGNEENKLYGYLLISMLFESITGLLLYEATKYDQLITNIFNGFYLSSMSVWVTIFSLYMIRISETDDKRYNRVKKTLTVLNILTILCALVLPRESRYCSLNVLDIQGIYT